MTAPSAVEFAEIARDLNAETGMDDALRRTVDYAMDITEAELGGVVMLDAGHGWDVVAASEKTVEQIDKLQESLQEGPGLTAVRTHDTIVAEHVADDGRWPRWGSAAPGLGVNSAVAACLYTGRRTIGTLNVYSEEPGALDSDDAESMQVLASHASVAIEFLQEEYGLRRAVETRNVIGQAQGLLMERYGLDSRRAFDVLRRYSQDTNIKLRAVAEELVATRSLPHLDA